MHTQSTTWGLILIGAGLVFLLTTQGYLTVDWDAIWRLWPAPLIYAGLVRILEYLGV